MSKRSCIHIIFIILIAPYIKGADDRIVVLLKKELALLKKSNHTTSFLLGYANQLMQRGNDCDLPEYKNIDLSHEIAQASFQLNDANYNPAKDRPIQELNYFCKKSTSIDDDFHTNVHRECPNATDHNDGVTLITNNHELISMPHDGRPKKRFAFENIKDAKFGANGSIFAISPSKIIELNSDFEIKNVIPSENISHIATHATADLFATAHTENGQSKIHVWMRSDNTFSRKGGVTTKTPTSHIEWHPSLPNCLAIGRKGEISTIYIYKNGIGGDFIKHPDILGKFAFNQSGSALYYISKNDNIGIYNFNDEKHETFAIHVDSERAKNLQNCSIKNMHSDIFAITNCPDYNCFCLIEASWKQATEIYTVAATGNVFCDEQTGRIMYTAGRNITTYQLPRSWGTNNKKPLPHHVACLHALRATKTAEDFKLFQAPEYSAVVADTRKNDGWFDRYLSTWLDQKEPNDTQKILRYYMPSENIHPLSELEKPTD